MILVFDTFLAKKNLYPNKYLDKLLDDVRSNSYTYRYQSKELIFLYTVCSLKNYPWKKIFINFDAESCFDTDEIKKKLKFLMPNAKIRKKRSSTGVEYEKFFGSISNNNDWVFFSPNNDHPYIGTNILDLNKLIIHAEKIEKKYNKNVSIYYSHFTETVNMIKKDNYLYFYTGHHYKILEENDFSYTVLTNHQPLESMQVMRLFQLQNLFKLKKNDSAIRLECLSELFSNKKIQHILIVPKFECCRHYDGYMHTINSVKHFIEANQVPPLFIPDGFFEKSINIREGYLDIKKGYVSINKSAKKYCFESDKDCADLKISEIDIPHFWKERIANIDVNPNYSPDKVQIKKNQNKILNPWENNKITFFLYFFRYLKIIFIKFKKYIKNLILG